MEYQALYRKYRPNTFDGVIGQKHITEILKNQVETGKTSHAYLFSGSRGTGKTSTAKILARAVNCLSPVNGEPCNECDACKIAADANMDVIELDAASNNGVDDMRALIEKAVFAPVSMKKKVYIIDEAHMLSGAAFNALLKTLEEPPAHVMFILATTEPHKIIPTITSRCQRFDFKRLRTNDIVDYLDKVVKQAGASIAHEGLETIARKANGGMRDALSLADQCISFCGREISAEDVYHILGSADFDAVANISQLLLNDNAALSLKSLDEIISGRDIAVFIQDLTQHFRNLLITKLCGNCKDILDCTDEDMKKLTSQAQTTTQERLMRAISILTEVQGNLKYYPQPRVLVETAFVRICSPEYQQDIESVLDRIDILEKKVKDGSFKTVQVAEINEKPIEQKKEIPKRELSKNAIEILNELKKYFEEDIYISVILTKITDVKINNNIYTIPFNDKIQYNSAKNNEDVLLSALNKIGYDIQLKLTLEDESETETLEEILKKKFESIKFVD